MHCAIAHIDVSCMPVRFGHFKAIIPLKPYTTTLVTDQKLFHLAQVAQVAQAFKGRSEHHSRFFQSEPETNHDCSFFVNMLI